MPQYMHIDYSFTCKFWKISFPSSLLHHPFNLPRHFLLVSLNWLKQKQKRKKGWKNEFFPPFYDDCCFSNYWNPYALIETKLVSLCTLNPFLYFPLIFLSRHKKSISTKRKTPEIPNEIENVDSALLLTFLSVYWSLFVESLLFSYKPRTFIIPVPCWKSVIFHFRIYQNIIMLYWFRNYGAWNLVFLFPCVCLHNTNKRGFLISN